MNIYSFVHFCKIQTKVFLMKCNILELKTLLGLIVLIYEFLIFVFNRILQKIQIFLDAKRRILTTPKYQKIFGIQLFSILQKSCTRKN